MVATEKFYNEVTHTTIHVGDKGGFIESDDNLSFANGDGSWLDLDSVAHGKGIIRGGSMVENSTLSSVTVERASTVQDSGLGFMEIEDSKVADSLISYRPGMVIVIENYDRPNSKVKGYRIRGLESNIVGLEVSIENSRMIDSKFASAGGSVRNSTVRDSELGGRISLMGTVVEDSGLTGVTTTQGTTIKDSRVVATTLDRENIEDQSIYRNDHIIPKYRLRTEDGIVVNENSGIKAYRIEALRDFGDVKKGDIGGYIRDEDNLINDVQDESWVYDDAIVHGINRVEGNSQVRDNAIVSSSAIDRESVVSGDSNLLYTTVTDGANVHNSKAVSGSIRDGNVVDSELDSSNVKRSDLQGAILDNTRAEGSVIIDSTLHQSSARYSFIDEDNTVQSSTISGSKLLAGNNIQSSRVTQSKVANSELSSGASIKNSIVQDETLQASQVELNDYEGITHGRKGYTEDAADAINLNEEDLLDLNDLEDSQGLGQ